MMPLSEFKRSRRRFLAESGALVVSFALARYADAQPAASAPGSLGKTPNLDSWIRVDADGAITVFTGKVELGQGLKTAITQIAAEELFVEPKSIRLVTADTARTPDEGQTAGSNSMKDSGTAVMNAAAQVREMLVELAATRFGVERNTLLLQDGAIRSRDGKSATYGELVANQSLHVAAKPQSSLVEAKARRFIGKSMPRVDVPGKVVGEVAYVHDLRLPNMVHARVVRPPNRSARLTAIDTQAVEKMPGVVKIVRNGSFLAVVAEREFQAIGAMRAVNRAAKWDIAQARGATDPYAALAAVPHEDFVIQGDKSPITKSWTRQASFRRPYQMHGSIGPSCAVALYEGEKLTVWTHSQGVYPLRGSMAEMLKMPLERVRCVHMEGSGCYGHNGADDVAADAALIAIALPGRPVRVQWMREQEHAWEPYGSAMTTTVQAVLQGGSITDWQFEVTSGPHSTRPERKGGYLAAAWLLQEPLAPPPPQPIPQPDGGGDRNSIPLYSIPNVRVVHRFVRDPMLRVSALRSLGAYMNVFSIESFMDELAAAANADPVAFRLRHLTDTRAQDSIKLAAERFGWSDFKRGPGKGRGFAFARYKNHAAYAAIAMEVGVDRDSGRIDVTRVVAAIDSGDPVNPDGIRNQTEGGIVQSLSWTLYEAVRFDDKTIESRDWASYPIMRFASVPRSVEVHVIERPGTPFLGTGEAAQGPTSAALANALADATGARIREIPLTPERVRAALSQA
jgi:CO/xanthine dehydrogenase Mo-binding subunit